MIDSHAHVAAAQFNADRDQVLARARAAGVRWIEIGTDVADSRRAVALASGHSDVIVGASVGVHPSDIAAAVDWEAIEKLLDHEQTVAVGEVGLDYHRGGTYHEQRPALERFIQLAVQKALPVVFHVRSGETTDAHADMLAFLQGLPSAQRPRGVMHTFSGTWEQAQEYLALGFYLSISGVVTFKKAPDMQQVAQHAPLNRLLIETDCPYLTPEPHRGARNEPAYVQYVAQKIADLRGLPIAEVATATEKNTLALFKL